MIIYRIVFLDSCASVTDFSITEEQFELACLDVVFVFSEFNPSHILRLKPHKAVDCLQCFFVEDLFQSPARPGRSAPPHRSGAMLPGCPKPRPPSCAGGVVSRLPHRACTPLSLPLFVFLVQAALPSLQRFVLSLRAPGWLPAAVAEGATRVLPWTCPCFWLREVKGLST